MNMRITILDPDLRTTNRGNHHGDAMQTRSTLDEHETLAAPARTAKHHLLAGWASMAGTTIEWYDF
ncbi:permease of the major facilitator superfamily protein, partial [Burkholderia sp. TJI49]